MRLPKNLRLIGFFTFFTNTLFLIPVLLPYYEQQIGIGYREFLYGESAFAAAIILFDVPTGWISDVWRRKHTLALGVVLNIAGYCVLLIAHSLWQAILAQSILGIGYSLLSGTHTALLYDSLLSAGQEERYRKLEGKRLALSLYAVAGASVIGSFLYTVNPYLPIFLSAATQALAFILACLLEEPERKKASGQKHPISDILATTAYALHGHAEVGFLIIFTAVMFCSTKLIMWSQQPYYMALNIPFAAFGLLMAIGYCLGGLSSHFGHLLDGKVNTLRALALAWLSAVLICIGAGFHLGFSGVVLLMAGGSCIYGMTSPRTNEAVNRLVGSERRATILSTQSFLTNSFAVPLTALTGWVAGQWGVQASLFAIAVWLCSAGICLNGWAKQRKKSKQIN